MQTYFLLKNECIYAKEQFTFVVKQQADLQEVCSPQYNSMLILHALRWDPLSGAHVHAHKCINGHTDTQFKTPTPLLSGFYKLSFKASVRCPRAPDMVTRIQNRLSERRSSTWKTVHLLLALNVCIFTNTFSHSMLILCIYI